MRPLSDIRKMNDKAAEGFGYWHPTPHHSHGRFKCTLSTCAVKGINPVQQGNYEECGNCM